MERPSSIFNFSKFPVAGLICLVLLLATEGGLRLYADKIYSMSDRIALLRKQTLFRSERLQYDALILGDSRGLGINAKSLSAEISADKGAPFRIHNFTLPNTGAGSYYHFLRHYVKRHAKPQVIFFTMAPLFWTEDTRFERMPPDEDMERHRFLLVFSYQDFVSAYPAHLLAQGAAEAAESLSFLLSQRVRIRNYIADFKQQDALWRDMSLVSRDHNGGFQFPLTKGPGAAEVMSSTYYQLEFQPKAGAVDQIRRFLDLAQTHRIKVIMFNAPILDLIYDHREATGFHARYSALLKELAGQYDNVELLNPLLGKYPRDCFLDLHHLNARGYRQFNRDFAERVSRQMTENF